MVADASNIARVDHEREDQLNSPIATKHPGLKRAIALLILATACLPLTALAQQQNFDSNTEFEYVEHWTAEFPPTEFQEPRTDLKDEDVILYLRTPEERQGEIAHEVFLIDKQTGHYISKAEVEIGGRIVKGELAYKGNYWIVLGQEEEIGVGSYVVVLDYRSGEILRSYSTLQHLNAFDFAANMVPLGDYVYTTGIASLALPSTMPRGGEVHMFLAAYNASTGQLVGRVPLGFDKNRFEPDQAIMEGLAPLYGQIVTIGTFPIAVERDSLEYIFLYETKLGAYRIGVPHVVLPLFEDYYLVGWYYNHLGETDAPVPMRPIRLSRVYRWQPNTEPELIQDSLIHTGVHNIGGALQKPLYWMHDDTGTIHIFDAKNINFGSLRAHARAIPNIPVPQLGSIGQLVMRRIDRDLFGPAIIHTNAIITLLDLNDKIEFDQDNFDWIINDHQILGRSTLTTPEQTILTFGEIQVKPTSN